MADVILQNRKLGRFGFPPDFPRKLEKRLQQTSYVREVWFRHASDNRQQVTLKYPKTTNSQLLMINIYLPNRK